MPEKLSIFGNALGQIYKRSPVLQSVDHTGSNENPFFIPQKLSKIKLIGRKCLSLLHKLYMYYTPSNGPTSITPIEVQNSIFRNMAQSFIGEMFRLRLSRSSIRFSGKIFWCLTIRQKVCCNLWTRACRKKRRRQIRQKKSRGKLCRVIETTNNSSMIFWYGQKFFYGPPKRPFWSGSRKSCQFFSWKFPEWFWIWC